jgi:riboflavin synthase alpha subunit
MATIAGHRLTLDPMGKCSNAFFSETTNMIKAKLYINVHWMVLNNLKVFCSDMKFKMVAMAGLSLTLDPMGKMFNLALIIFVVSEKKAFEHFPIGSNVNLCPAMVAILDFRSA